MILLHLDDPETTKHRVTSENLCNFQKHWKHL